MKISEILEKIDRTIQRYESKTPYTATEVVDDLRQIRHMVELINALSKDNVDS